MQKLDFIRSAEKTVTIDKAHLIESTRNLEKENLYIKEKLKKMHSIEEIDIHIDMLMNSDSGIELLRQKYGKLLFLF